MLCWVRAYGLVGTSRLVHLIGQILVAMNGAWHWQKRFSLAHLSGCRKIRHGGVFVDLSCELTCGLPHAAYLASDVQSDLAACQRLSPPYTGRSWISLGVQVHSLIGALVCSCTTGSVGFDQADVCFNAAAAYYLLLLHRVEAGRQWRQHLSLHTSTHTHTFAYTHTHSDTPTHTHTLGIKSEGAIRCLTSPFATAWHFAVSPSSAA